MVAKFPPTKQARNAGRRFKVATDPLFVGNHFVPFEGSETIQLGYFMAIKPEDWASFSADELETLRVRCRHEAARLRRYGAMIREVARGEEEGGVPWQKLQNLGGYAESSVSTLCGGAYRCTELLMKVAQ